MAQITIERLRQEYTGVNDKGERYDDMSDAELARRYTQATGTPVVGFETKKEVETSNVNESVSIGEDLSKSLGSAAWSAVSGILGLPGALTNTVEMGADILGMGSREPENRAFGFPEATSAVNRFREKLPPFFAGTDPNYEPQTRGGRYLKTASELAASGGAGAGRKMMTQVVAPTVMSEGGREVFEDTVLETPAQIAGLMAGGKMLDVAENTIAGGKVDPRRLEAVETLRNAGVEPTAGQATGLRSLSAAEDATAAGQAKRSAAVDQFTDAAINTAIPPTLRDKVQFTPDMMPQEKMEALRTTITSTMDQLAARNSVPITTELFEEVFKVSQDYKKKLSTAEKSPFFETLAKDMADVSQLGSTVKMRGSEFQRIRSELSELTTKDTITKNAAVKVIRALEDAMGKQISKGRNPEDIALYRDVRKGYSDLMILEAAAKRNKDVNFNITPSALANAARNKDAQSYVYGRDTFSNLYRAGDTVLKSAENTSRTAQAFQAMQPFAAPMTAAAATSLATDIPMLATMAVGGALPLMRNRALQSEPVQRYFKSTMRPGEPAPSASIPGILVGLQEMQKQMAY